MSDAPKQITLTLTGPFEPIEVADVINWLRALDSQHPGRHYELIIDSFEGTIGEAEQTLRSLIPEVPGRETKFSILKKQ